MDRFSTTLPAFTGSVENPALVDSLASLSAYLGLALPQLLWSEHKIALPWTAAVTLPPLGTYEGIDIREQEPLLLVLDLEHYPDVPPRIYPDRLDFPKHQLAHLYVAKEGKPPAFCLVRGSLSEWYANKQLKDVIIRSQNWLRDAAAGELTEDGNQYEPLRLEGYSGTVIYDYDQLATLVHSNQSFFPDQNFALALFERNQDEDALSFRLVRLLTATTMLETLEQTQTDWKKEKGDFTKKFYHYGYVLWSTSPHSVAGYTVDLPTDWHSFQVFCQHGDIDLTHFEEQLARYDPNGYIFFPVITAIKRPKPLIGYSSSIEFINFRFRVDSEDAAEGHIITNFPIAFQSHNQPLSLSLAKRLSGFSGQFGDYSIIYGCGALGSKVVMHFVRSGSTKLLLVDPDLVSPHNMVRYGLTAESIGLNKAYALKQTIQRLFPNEVLPTLRSSSLASVLLNKESVLKVFNWVFDFTASPSFLATLIKASLAPTTRVCRAFLTDGGQLGILLVEGSGRNPRLDDLQIMVYAACRDYDFIADWLQREKGPVSADILVRVGIGCNSETTVLSDDLISLHAAYFSAVIKSISTREAANEGKIYLNQLGFEPEFANQTTVLPIRPMDILQTRNESGWEIRFKAGLLDALRNEMVVASPHETGGVFIGCANYKTKTIHIIESIPAPPDSQANRVCFFRGIHGLPEQIALINQKSGGQVGYIGEWHTHPEGPNGLSSTDLNTVQQFKAEFDQLPTPLPVFLMVLTPDQILPYVY